MRRKRIGWAPMDSTRFSRYLMLPPPLLLWAKRACPLVSRQLSDYVLKRGMEAFRLSETFPTTAKSAIKESMAQLCFRRTTQISPWTIPMNVSVARPFDAGLSMALSRNDV